MAAQQTRRVTRARLYAILARESDEAVVFRRGPTRQVLLLRWNTANDAIEEGQWLKGRIYERRGDLSPDGKLLVYFAAKQPRSWTAISRPPYLTALALWPKGDAWGGGGHFASNSELLLNHWPNQMDLAPDFALPPSLTVRIGPFAGRGEDFPIWGERLSRDGWTFSGSNRWEKRNDDRTLVMRIVSIAARSEPWYVCEHSVVSNGRTFDIGRSDWADWDRRGDLVFAADGCLFRGFEDPQLIADLNDRKFVNRAVPAEFRRWPERAYRSGE